MKVTAGQASYVESLFTIGINLKAPNVGKCGCSETRVVVVQFPKCLSNSFETQELFLSKPKLLFPQMLFEGRCPKHVWKVSVFWTRKDKVQNDPQWPY